MKNQKGQAMLLSVVILSTVLVASLMAAYIYTENRLRFYAQIKEAYKLAEVTEAAARSIKVVWDQTYTRWVAGDPGAACSATPCTPDAFFTSVVLPNLNGGTTSICFDNADSATPYCFTMALNEGVPQKPFTKIDTFLAKLDHFFDAQKLSTKKDPAMSLKPPTLVGWLLDEKFALAHDRETTSERGGSHLGLVAGATAETGGPPGPTAIPAVTFPNCRDTPTSAACAQCNTGNTSSMGSTDSYQHQSRCVNLTLGGFNQPVRIPTFADKF